MHRQPQEPGHVPDHTTLSAGRLWATAAAVAALGAWVMFDARPGLNWLLWTGAAATGLTALHRDRHAQRNGYVVPSLGVAATLIAGAAAVTASALLHVAIFASVVILLAMQMLLAADPSLRRITARFAATAPPVALRRAVPHALRRAVEATGHIRSTRARAWVRGLALTLPVLFVFALLLAEADPTFARWRDPLDAFFSTWEFLPRVIFFTALLGLVVGAYGYALTDAAPPLATTEREPVRWLGSTERVMLLAAVTALLWLFLALQIGYLFGTQPNAATSDMTFAEYARRGFGELTVVASASALLVLFSEQYGQRDGHARPAQLVVYSLVVAVLLLLASAFHRVLLYEAAYGFTTARLYAQAYMMVVAAALVRLAVEVAHTLGTGRLFRRTAAVGTVLFVALLYVNHEAWIAQRNIERFSSTGKLDIAYLTRELSPDALPTIVDQLASLPEPTQAELRAAIRKRYATGPTLAHGRWFEWNRSRIRARTAQRWLLLERL
jgi:two-component system sensor histidine kinase BaeS